MIPLSKRIVYARPSTGEQEFSMVPLNVVFCVSGVVGCASDAGCLYQYATAHTMSSKRIATMIPVLV